MMADQENNIMSKVGEKRPDVVLLEHMHEYDFWCIIQNFMRRQGTPEVLKIPATVE